MVVFDHDPDSSVLILSLSQIRPESLWMQALSTGLIHLLSYFVGIFSDFHEKFKIYLFIYLHLLFFIYSLGRYKRCAFEKQSWHHINSNKSHHEIGHKTGNQGHSEPWNLKYVTVIRPIHIHFTHCLIDETETLTFLARFVSDYSSHKHSTKQVSRPV
jgi:hypothetical protein